MDVFVIIFLLITLFWAIKIDKCLINPVIINASIWLCLLVGYVTIDHGLYPLSDLFYVALMAWIVPFQLSCGIVSNLTSVRHGRHLSHPATPLITNKYIVLFVSLCIILAIFLNYQRAMSFDPTNIYSAWRDLSVAIRRGEEARYSTFHLNLIRIAQLGYIFCLIYLLRKSQFKYKNLFFILVFIYLILATDKGGILRFFIGCIGVLVFMNKLNIRVFIGIFLSLCIVIYLMQFFRGDSEGISLIDLLYIYLFSPLPAFDNYILHSQADLVTYFNGEFVFKNVPFIGQLMHSDYNPVNVSYYGARMVHVPLPTNVYTMMAGYWVGWKWTGLIIGGFLHGCFWGYIYGRSKKAEVYKVLYVSILNVLVFYFFHDFLLEHIGFHILVIFTLFFILYNPMFKYRISRGQ